MYFFVQLKTKNHVFTPVLVAGEWQTVFVGLNETFLSVRFHPPTRRLSEPRVRGGRGPARVPGHPAFLSSPPPSFV